MKKSQTEKKAALYIRVSTQNQVGKDSLPVQRADLIRYTRHALNIEAYDVFEDAGYSAKNTDRPAYQQMMTRMRFQEFTHLVVWKIDRISRNLLDFATMYQELKQLNVTFISQNEQFDTSSAMGEAMLKIILIFAELERKMTSERVSAIMLSRANNGAWNGGRVPYGYELNPETKIFTPQEQEAAVVREMFDLYEENLSLMKVSKKINASGITTRLGYAWMPTSVGNILKSPFYVGTMRYNYRDESAGRRHHVYKPKEAWILIEEHHPAIVSPEQWRRVNELMQENRRCKTELGTSVIRKNIHIFAGILVCGYCGSSMPSTVGRADSDGWRPSIYNCSRRRKFDDCPNKSISDIRLGNFVMNYLANMEKAKKTFTPRTTIGALERKLLRGEVFTDVAAIEREGLEFFYGCLKTFAVDTRKSIPVSGEFEEDGSPFFEMSEQDVMQPAREICHDPLSSFMRENIQEQTRAKRTLEEASDSENLILTAAAEASQPFSAWPESGYELEVLEEAPSVHQTHEKIIRILLEKRTVDYEKLIRGNDRWEIKAFINDITEKISVQSGRVVSIRFRDGMEHRFLYRENRADAERRQMGPVEIIMG